MLTQGLTSSERIFNMIATQSGSVVGLQVMNVANTDNTSCPKCYDSVAYESGGVVKDSPGILYSINCFNSKSSEQFIQVFDTVSVPSDGATPKVILHAPASSSVSLSFSPFGKAFEVGISWSNSSEGPTLASGSADMWTNILYM
ncbi:MAG: hypothetical protein WBK67_02945 [Minisyncoccales bacterium]